MSSKSSFHPRNKHQGRYDFKSLVAAEPDLKAFVIKNPKGEDSIQFSDQAAVKMINRALLKHHYGVRYWDFPDSYLCPPVPGRADYIHQLADLISDVNGGTLPDGEKVACLEIGVGANMIYPIIGVKEYGWEFLGSDIDKNALAASQGILDRNPDLAEAITLRYQPVETQFFKGSIRKGEQVDVTLCNPPFFRSMEEANQENKRKNFNLKQTGKVDRNFSGNAKELSCLGGESKFIQDMIVESKAFSKSCLWFTSLVSKKDHLIRIYKKLEKVGAEEVRTIEMHGGHKKSRIIAWTFKTPHQQKEWAKNFWK